MLINQEHSLDYRLEIGTAYHGLTVEEQWLFDLVMQDFTLCEMAEQLDVSTATVHRKRKELAHKVTEELGLTC